MPDPSTAPSDDAARSVVGSSRGLCLGLVAVLGLEGLRIEAVLAQPADHHRHLAVRDDDALLRSVAAIAACRPGQSA